MLRFIIGLFELIKKLPILAILVMGMILFTLIFGR